MAVYICQICSQRDVKAASIHVAFHQAGTFLCCEADLNRESYYAIKQVSCCKLLDLNGFLKEAANYCNHKATWRQSQLVHDLAMATAMVRLQM